MDRRTQTLALSFAMIWASGCAAPFAKRATDEKSTSEQATNERATSNANAPAQTAAAVEETLHGSKTPAAQRGADARADSADDAQASDDQPQLENQPLAAEAPGRTPALAKRGGSVPGARDNASDPAVDRQTLLDVIAEMEAAGVLDAKARGQLLDDLKQTDPMLWPQLIAYFQASLARESRTDRAKPVAHRAAAEFADHTDTTDEVFISDGHESTKPTHRSAAPPAADLPPQFVTPAANATPPKTPLAANAATTPAAADANPKPAVAPVTSPVAAPVATANSSDADWREHLAAAIKGLEQETAAPPESSAAVGRHAALRLLYLADGRREDAVRPIAGVPPAQQDFWSKELFGLATYLDAERNSETSRRAAEAGVHLQGAAQRLAELATLQVKNLSFCTEVSSFGVYKKFAQYEFQAGQEVLLYAEVENFRSEQTEKGFHTALKASYQILDSHGARVAEHEFKLTEEYCQNARRDYFTNYFVWLPKRIYGGAYTLQLTLEDVKGQKIGQSSLDFTIKEKP